MTRKPEPLGRKYDVSSQTKDQDIFTSDFSFENSPTVMRITAAFDSASTIKIVEDDGSTEETYILNSGQSISANELNTFDVPVRNTSTYNIQLGTTVGIQVLQVDEIGTLEA